jgi:Holliday junction DNA helicase RuvA
MYAYLEGILKEKHPTRVVLDVGGIGFELIVSLSTSQTLPEVNKTVKLLTEFVVREDSQQLFGFGDEEERDLFRLLRSVSGIGPKLAVTILSGLSPRELAGAINHGNLATLNAITGVGKKTAERILVELKGKVNAAAGDSQGSASGLAGDERLEDALQALISLGYKKASAETALQKALQGNDSSSVADLVRDSLKKI